ncbi:MAG: ATP-dependent DNA helicase RecG, partial [Gammaproteobacteria bacterium]|nr:ATP-dependent DNA helicase RecG [Gammaproteobacteria bacterium]
MELAAIPVSMLKGVGSKLAEKLTHLRLHTVQDLLFHLPLRYEDRTRLYPIAELSADHACTTEGVLQSCDIQQG